MIAALIYDYAVNVEKCKFPGKAYCSLKRVIAYRIYEEALQSRKFSFWQV